MLSMDVDATFSSGLGRLVNVASSNKANCVMRKIKEGTKIYLALYALRDIMIGEELRYDYGVKDLPWRNRHVKDKKEVSVDCEEVVACTVEEASVKANYKACNDKVEDSLQNCATDVCRAVVSKQARDGLSDEVCEYPRVEKKKNSSKKRKVAMLETDSEGEENDGGSVEANCDSNKGGKIKSAKLEVQTNRVKKAVVSKQASDALSDEVCEYPRVEKKKNNSKKQKAAMLETDSEGEENDGGSVEANCDSNKGGKIKSAKLEVETNGVEKVVISCSKKGLENARIYDKRQACFYCDKLYGKIARHYEHNHKDEAEVAEAFAYPLGSKDRRKALDKLRLQGNFHHNLRVLESKSGQLIVMRRPGEDDDCSQDDYLPCVHCLGFVKRKDLWRHNKTCSFKSSDKDEKEDGGDYLKCQKLQTKSKLLILPSVCPGKSSPFQEVVASMKSDQITLVARNDTIIAALGTMMVEKVGTRRSHDISNNMRNLARLLISLREAEHNENAQVSQFLCPEKFDAIVQCVMAISKFDVKRGEKEVGTPSLALHIGHALKKCVGIVRGKALREKDKGLLEDIENFEKLMEAEWNYRISHHSLTTLNDRKLNQPDLLPVASDLQKLKEYITSKIISLTSQLQATSIPAVRTWRELSELVLNRLILFNKRRGGETARLRLETYNSRPDWQKSTNQDVVSSLSGIEQQLFKRLDMVEIKGKRGRMVPILLTKEVKKAIDVLVEKRSEVGVNPNNPYLFAAGSGSLGHLRPWECMRKVVTNKDLQLEKPEAVTSTRLRKYVATVSQILDLQENELDWLARHLGHDIGVHREYYRLHESTIELAKVGKILTTVDDGKISQWAGKSLDEIDLNIGQVADDSESGSEKDSDDDGETELPCTSDHVRNKQQRGMEKTSSSKPSTSALNAKTRKTKHVKKAVTKENSGPTAILRKKKTHIAWTKEEKEAVFKYLGEFVKKKIVPGKRDCENCIKQSGGLLANRDWSVVKDCVRNIISRAKALQQKNA